MEELFAIGDFYQLFDKIHSGFLMLALMLLAFYPLYFLMRRLITPSFDKIIRKRGEKLADILKKRRIYHHLMHLFISFYLIFWSEIFVQANLFSPTMLHLKSVVLGIYATTCVALTLMALLNVFVEYYRTRSSTRRVPIGLHAHIIKIIISIAAILVVLSNVLGLNISALLTSLGAAAALLTFVFKDTVLGLLASLQLTFQDIIRVGDWITVPAHNADGNVEMITITVVKVRNFDNTITTVPTHALIAGGTVNWRGMQDSGGRRIKRSVNLDIDTVKFLTQKELDKFAKLDELKEIKKTQPELFKAANKVSNLTIFRHYLKGYLARHKMIHNDGFTFLVRQLQSTAMGVPIEVYVFTNDTNWVVYEGIQADIFDHIFGILPDFDLRAFQRASGTMK